MERHIVHMDLDTFFVSVERLKNHRLIGKPVLVGGTSDRGVVASCIYEARKFGIHSAMTMRISLQLCPEAIVVKGDGSGYSQYSQTVSDIIKEHVPAYEKTSIDEFYIDLTGMDRFFGCYQLATNIRKSIMKETDLPISFALSSCKTVSKVGTGEAKPNGQRQIAFGLEKPFLAPLSIRKIPMIGDKTFTLLRSMGVSRILTLQEMPQEMLERVLGENGRMIWNKANGIDHSPVVAYSEQKSISTEHTFDKDTIDLKVLNTLFISMAENLAFQLRQLNKLTACITVKIRYSDFNTYTMQARIPYTSLDHVLIEKAKELFKKLFQKRMLIRLVGIRLSHLVQGNYQYNLFENITEQVNLYSAMDRIRYRYGATAITRAAGMDVGYARENTFNGIVKSQGFK